MHRKKVFCTITYEAADSLWSTLVGEDELKRLVDGYSGPGEMQDRIGRREELLVFLDEWFWGFDGHGTFALEYVWPVIMTEKASFLDAELRLAARTDMGIIRENVADRRDVSGTILPALSR